MASQWNWWILVRTMLLQLSLTRSILSGKAHLHLRTGLMDSWFQFFKVRNPHQWVITIAVSSPFLNQLVRFCWIGLLLISEAQSDFRVGKVLWNWFFQTAAGEMHCTSSTVVPGFHGFYQGYWHCKAGFLVRLAALPLLSKKAKQLHRDKKDCFIFSGSHSDEIAVDNARWHSCFNIFLGLLCWAHKLLTTVRH